MEKDKNVRQIDKGYKWTFWRPQKDCDVMKRNFASPSVMKNEIRAAMRRLKLGKTTGADSMSVELLKHFKTRIDKFTTLLNKIN